MINRSRKKWKAQQIYRLYRNRLTIGIFETTNSKQLRVSQDKENPDTLKHEQMISCCKMKYPFKLVEWIRPQTNALKKYFSSKFFLFTSESSPQRFGQALAKKGCFNWNFIATMYQIYMKSWIHLANMLMWKKKQKLSERTMGIKTKG